MPDGPTRHITEALGGRLVAPLSHEERIEYERVSNLIRAVLACYNSLVNQEPDESRRTDLEVQRALHTDRFRRGPALPPAERREVLDTYPELLDRLRADLDG